MNPNMMAQHLMMSQGAPGGDEMMILVLVMVMSCCCILLLGAYYYMKDDDDKDEDDNCKTYTNQITCDEDTTCSWDETTYTCEGVTVDAAPAASSSSSSDQPVLPSNAAGSGGTPEDDTITNTITNTADDATLVTKPLCLVNQKIVNGVCVDCPTGRPTTMGERADPNIVQDSPSDFCKKSLCLKDQMVVGGNCWSCNPSTRASDAGADPNLGVDTTCDRCKVDHFINADGECEACPSPKRNANGEELFPGVHTSDPSVCIRDPCLITEKMVCTVAGGCNCVSCGNGLYTDTPHTVSPDDPSMAGRDFSTNCTADDSIQKQQDIIEWILS